jgi:hypothetical protein
MSLPKYLPLLVLVLLWAWVCLRRANQRLRRIEEATGAWRVQPPWGEPAWYASDEFDKALAQWPQPIVFDVTLTDEEVARFMETWEREHGTDAA